MNSTVAAATKPSNTNNKIKHSTGENVGTFVIYLVVALFALICVLPFVLVIIVSFSSEKSITINGYSFWPSEWSAAAYKMLFLPSSSVPQSLHRSSHTAKATPLQTVPAVTETVCPFTSTSPWFSLRALFRGT